jgi:hypothetical protein
VYFQIVTASNYSAFSNSRSLQFTTAVTESSHSPESLAVVADYSFQLPNFLSFRVHVLTGRRLSPQLTILCWATTWTYRGSSASHTSTRVDCLTTASDSDWFVCLQILSRFFSSLSTQIDLVTVTVKVTYEWRFTAKHVILASNPLRLRTRDFFQLNFCGHNDLSDENISFFLMNMLGFPLKTDLAQSQKSKLYYDRRSVSQFVLE